MLMRNKILLVLTVLFTSMNTFGQMDDGFYYDLGVEVQQYPTGFLYGVRGEIGWTPYHAIDWRVGYNLLDHKDFGEHESEKGGGFGFTLGYRKYFKPTNQGWFLGIRSDLWWNEVSWKDNIGKADEVVGTTKITVFQPTAIGGYGFLFNNLLITPTVAFGGEFNIKTKGEKVGQGSIFLWGINLAYRF